MANKPLWVSLVERQISFTCTMFGNRPTSEFETSLESYSNLISTDTFVILMAFFCTAMKYVRLNSQVLVRLTQFCYYFRKTKIFNAFSNSLKAFLLLLKKKKTYLFDLDPKNRCVANIITVIPLLFGVLDVFTVF